jgi:hypothetical protein
MVRQKKKGGVDNTLACVACALGKYMLKEFSDCPGHGFISIFWLGKRQMERSILTTGLTVKTLFFDKIK